MLYLNQHSEQEATDWEAQPSSFTCKPPRSIPSSPWLTRMLPYLTAGFIPERSAKAKARAQAEEALRLSPKLGEGHVALGLCLYVGEKKYDAALKEFEIADRHFSQRSLIFTIMLVEFIGARGVGANALVSFDRADLPRSSEQRYQQVCRQQSPLFARLGCRRCWLHSHAGD